MGWDSSKTHALPFTDFPVELSSAEEGSVALLKCATFEKLLEKVIIEDHGDEEAYAAFCFKIHVFGSLEEVLERLLLVLEERREVGEIGGVCKFLNFFFQQPFFGLFFLGCSTSFSPNSDSTFCQKKEILSLM